MLLFVKAELIIKMLKCIGFQKNNHMKIEIDKNGRIDNWPKGFFDSIDEDFEILIRGNLDGKINNS